MTAKFRHCGNSMRYSAEAERDAAEAVANLSGWRAAVNEFSSLPEYRVEPLHSLPHLAASMCFGEHPRALGLERHVARRSRRPAQWLLSLRDMLVVGGRGERQDSADRLDPHAPPAFAP